MRIADKRCAPRARPGTVPRAFCRTYLQPSPDLDVYDTHFQPGAYLPIHPRHLERWPPGTRAT